jgi:hypothetical protein
MRLISFTLRSGSEQLLLNNQIAGQIQKYEIPSCYWFRPCPQICGPNPEQIFVTLSFYILVRAHSVPDDDDTVILSSSPEA